MPEQKQPELICWSDNVPGRMEWQQDDPFMPFKRLIYDGLEITVGIQLGSEGTYVSFECHNESRKAIGLGIEGFGVVVTANGQKTTLACKSLTNYGKEENSVMVDTGGYCRISATFGAAPQSDSADIVVQSNRILAAPLMFMFSFELSQRPSRESKGAQYRLGQELWARKSGLTNTVDAIEGGIPFSFMRYDPDDKRLVGGLKSFLRHASGPRKTYTWITLWDGSEWIECGSWEEATPPPQSLLKTFVAKHSGKKS